MTSDDGSSENARRRERFDPVPHHRCFVCGNPVRVTGGISYGEEYDLGATGGRPGGVIFEVGDRELPCHFACIEEGRKRLEAPDFDPDGTPDDA